MQNVLIDAGPMIALFDSSDEYHHKIKQFLKKNAYNYISSWPVLTEVCHMLDFNLKAQIDFLKWINYGAVKIETISQKELSRIIKLSEKYSNVPMDLADATLVLIAEKNNLDKIVTIDNDYYIYRTVHNKLIENIFQ